jgi:hypothetical protein
VKWYDQRTISHAPWISDCRPEEMEPDIGYSMGMSDDLPDEMAILVRPHFFCALYEDDRARYEGDIVIPYSSIRMIRRARRVRRRARSRSVAGTAIRAGRLRERSPRGDVQ